MALDLNIFGLLIGLAFVIILFALSKKVGWAFLIGCLLLGAAGASIFVYDGLSVGRELSSVAPDGSMVYSDTVVSSSNLVVSSIGLILIVVSFLSFFLIDFSDTKRTRNPVFHY